MKKRLLSGMRPTGPMHLGHLLGALKYWVEMQARHDCYFMVADWHALMSEYEAPSSIGKYTSEMVADWIAAGIDPRKATIFRQSDVKEHLELFTILSDIVPLPWLERCPTYKEQLREMEGRDLTTYGFLGYPVLQAADILIYKAESVPVGEDQRPHLELTREIARRFNKMYEKIFCEPEALLSEVPRLLGTDNRKMSKSYNNFIALGDSADMIKKKVSSMITDPKRIKLSDRGNPKICNVFSYFEEFKADTFKDVENWCRNATKGCTECKAKLADILIESLRPYREKSRLLLKDKEGIEGLLRKGAEKASALASKTISEVYRAMGLKG